MLQGKIRRQGMNIIATKIDLKALVISLERDRKKTVEKEMKRVILDFSLYIIKGFGELEFIPSTIDDYM